MDRRKFLLGGAASTTLLPGISSAQTETCKARWSQKAGNYESCAVGIPISSTPRQECPNWCWAACCEAIFGLAGYSVGQTQFV